MRIIESLLLSGLLLCSCNPDKSRGHEGFADSVSLRSDYLLSLDSIDILNPIEVASWGNMLLIRTLDGMLIGIDPERMSRVGSYTSIGQGPGEITSLTSFNILSDTTIGIYDGNIGRYLIAVSDAATKAKTEHSDMFMYTNLVQLPNGNLLGTPFQGEYSYELFSHDGIKIDSLHYYPPKPDGISEVTHSMACAGAIALNQYGDRFVRTIYRDGGIDFFEVINNEIKHIHRFAYSSPQYETFEVGSHILPKDSEKSIEGFFSPQFHGDKVYALFSDEIRKPGGTWLEDEILVFSQDGEPLLKYKLDKGIRYFTFDKDDNIIALVPDGEENYLVRYSLGTKKL